ncbi:hypothetical protein [Aeromonas caviae]|uniref:hypothetical protein n=1 Tax=Aeromonas caviae TaxID=648 RepID=UPI002B48A7E9|nr:hypothetical protein [Aeromonas caviae]
MKDQHDTQTQDLISTRRSRGRPATGKALSPAEKQARYRARKAQKTVTVTINREDVKALKMILANATGAFQDISDDTCKRLFDAVFDAAYS